jgi:hypothetical protein
VTKIIKNLKHYQKIKCFFKIVKIMALFVTDNTKKQTLYIIHEPGPLTASDHQKSQDMILLYIVNL